MISVLGEHQLLLCQTIEANQAAYW